MIATEQSVLTKKLKIKFPMITVEANPAGAKSCSSVKNVAQVKQWEKNSPVKRRIRPATSSCKQYKMVVRSGEAHKVHTADTVKVNPGQVNNGETKKTNVTKLNCRKTPSLDAKSLHKRSMAFDEEQKLKKELYKICGLTCESEEESESDIDSFDDQNPLKLRKVTETFNDARVVEVKHPKTTLNGNTRDYVAADSGSLLRPDTSKCGVDNDSIHESLNDRSLSSKYPSCRTHAPREIVKQETYKCGRKSNLDSVEDQSICSKFTPSTPTTAATSREESRTFSVFDTQLSPEKALRAACLKNRFAGIIAKTQQGMLLDHGIKTAQKRPCDLKMQREKQREASRIAIQKMEKTVELDTDNIQTIKEFYMLCDSPQSDDQGGFDISSTTPPLEQLGLFRKEEYFGDSDDEDMA